MGFLLNPFVSFPVEEPSGEGSLPDGATWHLDFVNGFYWAGGAEQIIGDIFGGAFNPTYLTGAGLDTQYTNDNRPDAAGVLFTDMQTMFEAGMSVIFEIDGELQNAHILMFPDAVDPGDVTNAPSCGSQAYIWVDDWIDLNAQCDNMPALVDGIHRIGATWFRDIGGGDFESAVCLDGDTAGTQTTNYGPITPPRILVGHGGDLLSPSIGTYNQGFVIRSITGYPAVTPAELSVLTGDGGALPAGATAHLDFVNGFYYAGGTEQTLTDLLGEGNPGSNLDLAYFTASGMDTQSTNLNRPDAIGDLFTDLVALWGAGISVVIEVDVLAGGEGFGDADIIGFWDDTDPNSASNVADIFSQSNLFIEDFNSVFVGVDNDGMGLGHHKVGGTWFLDVGGGNFQSAVCVDGNAPATDTTAYGASSLTCVRVSIGHLVPDAPYFFGVTNNGFVIRSMTFYPAMSSAALQALTA